MFSFQKLDKAAREAAALDQAKRRRDELLRVAAAVVVNPDDVVGLMAERHQDMSNASRDQVHMLYNAIAAELAVNRAKALISEVDKSP